MSAATRGNLIGLCLCIVATATALMFVKERALNPSARSYSGPSSGISTFNGDRSEQVINYDVLRRKITYGQASFFELRQAMTDPSPRGLSNSVHALFSMRIQRGVLHALRAMWNDDRESFPEFSWDLIQRPEVRLAVASTLNRIQIVGADEYKNYIRDFKNSDDSYLRAQVVVALGFNGALDDLPYLADQADGDDHYVAQSAITALSLFGGNQARDEMIKLAKKHQGSKRGDLIQELLRAAYGWPPAELNPLSKG